MCGFGNDFFWIYFQITEQCHICKQVPSRSRKHTRTHRSTDRNPHTNTRKICNNDRRTQLLHALQLFLDRFSQKLSLEIPKILRHLCSYLRLNDRHTHTHLVIFQASTVQVVRVCAHCRLRFRSLTKSSRTQHDVRLLLHMLCVSRCFSAYRRCKE